MKKNNISGFAYLFLRITLTLYRKHIKIIFIIRRIKTCRQRFKS